MNFLLKIMIILCNSLLVRSLKGTTFWKTSVTTWELDFLMTETKLDSVIECAIQCFDLYKEDNKACNSVKFDDKTKVCKRVQKDN